jgi:hypothetical protein
VWSTRVRVDEVPASSLACVFLVDPLPARLCLFRMKVAFSSCTPRFCVSQAPEVQAQTLRRIQASVQLGETETSLVAVEGLLWTGSPILFLSVRGHATGGRYVPEGRMLDRIVKYANWNGQ